VDNRYGLELSAKLVGVLLVCLSMAAVGCGATTTVIEQVDQSAGADGGASATQPDPAVAAAPDSEADDQTATDSQEPSSSELGAVVVLLDAGTEPRQELRMDIAASCGEVLRIEQTQEMTQAIDEVALPSGGAVGTVMEMAVTVASNGDNYDVRSEVVDASAASNVDPVIAEDLTAELRRIVGMTSYATMTDRGVQVPGTVRLEGAEALGPFAEMLESINQTQSPLPVEAVGIGARWETTQFLEANGLVIENVTETTVVSVEGTRVELSLTGFQRVEVGQVMSIQGFEAEITEWDIAGTGTTLIDLATISPIRATTVAQGRQAFSAPSIGGTLNQDVVIESTITSEPDEGCTGRTVIG